MKNRIMKLVIICLTIIFLVQCSLPEPEDITSPVVVILYPYNGSVLSNTVSVSIESSDDNSIANVWYYLDGEQMNSSTLRNPRFELDVTSYADGQTHVFQAAASDEEGNIGYSTQVSVIISNSDDITAPQIILLYPVEGSILYNDTVTVALDVLDENTITKVEFFIDGGINGNPNYSKLNPPWNYIWDTRSLADSTEHTLYLKAFDEAENVGVYGPVTYTIY